MIASAEGFVGQGDFVPHDYQRGVDVITLPSAGLGLLLVSKETYQAPGFSFG